MPGMMAVASRRCVFVILAVVAALTAARCAETGAVYPGAKAVTLDRIEFDDGDTFLLDGKPVRILGIDTPETASPGVGIMEDQPYGPEAAAFTEALLAGAARIELAFDGRDTYGRRLAHVFVDGELLAVKLLERSLAYETVSHFGDNGFPDLADRILAAADAQPKPAFEEPYKWRRKHQHRK
jgi:endonuclease YncB( thermonuclease family)